MDARAREQLSIAAGPFRSIPIQEPFLTPRPSMTIKYNGIDVKIVAQFKLTERERETVGFLVEGLTSKEIADHMNISPNTVKAFIRLVMVKMGVSTRAGIVGKILKTVSKGDEDLGAMQL